MSQLSAMDLNEVIYTATDEGRNDAPVLVSLDAAGGGDLHTVTGLHFDEELEAWVLDLQTV